jgi:hypothetical protein
MKLACLQAFFFFPPSFFLCSPTGDHSQEDLAKFGNRPEMKVENFKNPFVFWLLAKTCCKILAIYMCVCARAHAHE